MVAVATSMMEVTIEQVNGILHVISLKKCAAFTKVFILWEYKEAP
jgi:hypothetical protein